MLRIPLKAYGAALAESRTVVVIPDSSAERLIADLQAQRKSRRRVDL